MKENEKKFTVTLSFDNPLHRAAWEVFETLPRGKRTEYICQKVTEKHKADELSGIVYTNTLRALKDYGGEIQKPNIQENRKADEVEQNFFGFLSSLAKEGG